ncbi:unnamed protein product [Sphenostylis stenocarpa]|uniref:SAM-dependent MTase DRM-type domain-containing protein n=1 Tax=Sphenostylis stenocarpa TaxID=92480 RepID=A0AA86RYB4_9FABA|nr:unnamed protein product [Sphenostylis stenocarpa]
MGVLILPMPPMTIEEVIPRTKKWWPPWDSRKQLSNIYCETSGVAQTCDRLGKILADAGGVLTSKLQEDIIRYCRGLNLVWIGKFKLGPVEPEQLELILGYPINHTRLLGDNLAERLRSLKYCFQHGHIGVSPFRVKAHLPSWIDNSVVSVETSRQIERFLRGGGVNLGKLGLWFGLKTFKN